MLRLPCEKAALLYRICKITVIVLVVAWLITSIAVTLISAFDSSMLASPLWGLLFMLGTLPGVLLLVGSFLFMRRLLVIKTAKMPQKEQRRETAFAITLFTLLLLSALCCVLWLAGLFYLMYVAAACPILIGVLFIVRYIRNKQRSTLR